MNSWFYYSAAGQLGKSLVLAVLLLVGPSAAAEDGLRIDSGPGQVGGVAWDELRLNYSGPPGRRQLELEVFGLVAPEGQALGELRLTCSEMVATPVDGCRRGSLIWTLGEPALRLESTLAWDRRSDGWQVQLEAPGWTLAGAIPTQDPMMAELQLSLDGFDLSVVPAELLQMASLNVLIGQLDGHIALEQGQVNAELSLRDGGFDSLDGSLAADGLALDLELALSPLDLEPGFSIALAQSAGELLVGSMYLPPPVGALTLDLAGSWSEAGELTLAQIALEDPGALSVRGRAALKHSDDGWALDQIELTTLQMSLPLAWARWMDGPAAGLGFGNLDTEGSVDGTLSWRADGPFRLDMVMNQVTLDDPAGRIRLDQIDGTAVWGRAGPELDLAWQGLTLYGLPFGAARLDVDSGPQGVQLRRPLRLPLLDGAIVLEDLDWQPADPESEGFGFDARIEPLELGDLTELLGWPVFGGQLGGEFPGVRFVDDTLRFTGGIDIQAFSGQISLAELSIERPFGTLPAVSAQLEFSRLDLLELTGAFNFGRMEGQMSGWAHNLRLLDWRPVAMDARIFTHEDVPRRRISQRAVDNLSSLGGAGGALISGTVLRFFEDFPYRRAGLACRLSNNICHIDGVARHESGGFYIIEGRALPRLDVIGHRRLIDWPQLIRQLEAMMEERPE